MTEAPETGIVREPAVTRVGLLASLRYRGYLMLWLTHMASSSEFWMEQVARPWLVYEMTDSVFALGAIQAVRGLPVILFAGVGGVLADRMNRNVLYIVTKGASAAMLVGMTALLVVGRLEVWHIFALTLAGGIANSMEFPIRQSLIPSVVPRHALLNALSLAQVGRQFTHVAGPAVAGVLIAFAGIGGTYLVISVLALSTVLLPTFINAPRGLQSAQHESVRENVLGAIRYVRGNEIVLTLILLALAPNLLLRAWQPALAVFARDILEVGPEGFGMLNTAVGIGSLGGAVVLASFGSLPKKGAILVAGAGLQAAVLILFSFSHWFLVSLALMAIVGVVQTAYFAMNNALLLTHTAEDYRGRVLSLYDTDRGLVPLGALLLGWLATAIDTPTAVALMAAPIIPMALGVLWLVPRFRDAE